MKSLLSSTAATAAVVIALSGCSTAPSGSSKSGSAAPHTTSTTKASATSTASSAEASEQASTSGDPQAQRVTVDPATAGATKVSLVAQPEGVQADSFRFAKARNLSTATEVVRNRMLRGAWFSDAQQVTITSQIIASSDAVVGVRMVAKPTVGADTFEIPSTVWYSTAGKQTYSSPALVKTAQWQAFAAKVAEVAGDGVDKAKLGKALVAPAAPYGNGPALEFNSAGDLMVAFRSGAVASDAQTVTIPAADATPLLSQLGSQAQSAATKPSAFTGTTTAAADPDLKFNPKSASARPSTAIGPDCRVVKCVAVTYDDGPGAQTPTLMATAKKHQVPITFFQMGNSIQAFPDIARKTAAHGFEVGSHSVTHPDLARVSAARLEREIAGNQKIMAKASGIEPMIFRPPYGSHNAAVDAVAKAHGLSVMQWEVDTMDWSHKSSAKTTSAALGAINHTAPMVLGHDIQQASIDAAPAIYTGLKQSKRVMVTVSELSLNSGGYLPGHAYCRGTMINQEGFNCRG